MRPFFAFPPAFGIRKTLVLFLLGSLAGVVTSLAPARPARGESGPTEYEIKGAFLYNFARFTTWPASAFEDADAPIRITILGEDPFGPTLDAALEGRKAKGRDVAVERVGRDEREHFGHILFVGADAVSDLPEILAAIAGRPVLTVSDIDGCADRGGVIEFAQEEQRVRFLINRVAEREAHLQISASLLSLAQVVRE